MNRRKRKTRLQRCEKSFFFSIGTFPTDLRLIAASQWRRYSNVNVKSLVIVCVASALSADGFTYIWSQYSPSPTVGRHSFGVIAASKWRRYSKDHRFARDSFPFKGEVRRGMGWFGQAALPWIYYSLTFSTASPSA